MQIRPAIFAVVIVIGLPALAAPVAPFTEPEIHDGLSPPATAWGNAMETGDLPALRRMYGPDAISYPPGGETKAIGVDAIMRSYAALFAKYTVRVANTDTHWVEEPPLVVSWGLTTLTLHPKAGGRDVVSRTRFTDAAVRYDGGWRYLVDHASKPTK